MVKLYYLAEIRGQWVLFPKGRPNTGLASGSLRYVAESNRVIDLSNNMVMKSRHGPSGRSGKDTVDLVKMKLWVEKKTLLDLPILGVNTNLEEITSCTKYT